MSETIHSGNGTQRGVIIALVVLVIFIAGIAMLGNGSAPSDDAAPTVPAEAGAADTNG